MGDFIQRGCVYCTQVDRTKRFASAYKWNSGQQRICLVFHGRFEATPVQELDVLIRGYEGMVEWMYASPWGQRTRLLGSVPVASRLIEGIDLASLEFLEGTIRVGERLVFENGTGGRGLTELPIAHIILG